MTDTPSTPETPTQSPAERAGDPLDGLWHWSYHPVIRAGILIGILIALLIVFPLLAQVTF